MNTTETNLFSQDSYYFSHLIVDGVEVYDDPEAYLMQHFDELKEIEIIAILAKEFVNDLLLSAEDYLTRVLPQVSILAIAITGEAQSEQWTDLNDLFEGVQWITSMVTPVGDSIARPTNWD